VHKREHADGAARKLERFAQNNKHSDRHVRRVNEEPEKPFVLDVNRRKTLLFNFHLKPTNREGISVTVP
jgi:hypothetical protein